MQKTTIGNLYSHLPDNIFVYHGNLVGVNKWHGARTIRRNGKLSAMIYENKVFKDSKTSFGAQASVGMRKFEGYVHFSMDVWLWKMKDTDGVLKGIFDALEQFGIIQDDKNIVNVTVRRHYHKKKEQDMAIIKLENVSPEEMEYYLEQMNGGYAAGGSSAQ